MMAGGNGMVLSLAAARDHLRLDSGVDEELEAVILAAEAALADFLGRPLTGEGGWADAASVPANVIHAIKLVLSDLWENRSTPIDTWPAVRALIGRYVVIGIG